MLRMLALVGATWLVAAAFGARVGYTELREKGPDAGSGWLSTILGFATVSMFFWVVAETAWWAIVLTLLAVGVAFNVGHRVGLMVMVVKLGRAP